MLFWCTEPTNGWYIMYPNANDGTKTNNKLFSSDSIASYDHIDESFPDGLRLRHTYLACLDFSQSHVSSSM